MNRVVKMVAAAVATVLVTSGAAMAQGMAGPVYKPATPPPQILNNISIDQNLNKQLPLDLAFKDETGKDVKL